jgi:Spy/CpxP family protein refolding chaperone
VAALVAGSVQAQELSAEQQDTLLELGVQYTRQAATLEGMIDGKLAELEMELTREGRLDTEEAAKIGAEKVNVILKDASGLYGEFIRSRVAFMLEAKNVLTMEQRLHLLAQLEPDELLDYHEVEYLQPDIFELPISLDLDQRRKLVRLEAGLIIKEVKLERDIELVMLELEEIFTAEVVDTEKVDKNVMKLADLAAKAIDNRVEYFIEAKDVLTLEQKRMLAYMLGL